MGMGLEAIKVGIRGYFENHADCATLKAAVKDRFFHGAAPQGTPKPYLRWFVVDQAGDAIQTFTEKFEYYLIQVDVISGTSSSLEASRLADMVADAFDDCENKLDVDGYTVMEVTRGKGRDLPKLSEEDDWNPAVDYRIQMMKIV